jgi:DNA gyrase subunit B
VALKDASVFTGGDSPQTLTDATLAELARKHQVAEAVIARLSAFMDAEALRAVADGVAINLDSVERGRGQRRGPAGPPARPGHHRCARRGAGEFDARTDKPILRISRRHHGNVKSSVITQTSCTAPTTPRWPRPA